MASLLLEFVEKNFSKEMSESMDSFVVSYLVENVNEFGESNKSEMESLENFSKVREDLNSLCEDYLNGFSKLKDNEIYSLCLDLMSNKQKQNQNINNQKNSKQQSKQQPQTQSQSNGIKTKNNEQTVILDKNNNLSKNDNDKKQTSSLKSSNDSISKQTKTNTSSSSVNNSTLSYQQQLKSNLLQTKFDKDIASLTDMFPDADPDRIKKTYELSSQSVSRAAELLLESLAVNETIDVEEQDLSLDNNYKQRLLTNFDMREDDTGVFHKPHLKMAAKDSNLRFRDNVVVSKKGEKFIFESLDPSETNTTKSKSKVKR